MKTAEQNYFLLQEIEENREFLLMAYQQNPELLKRADARIKQIFEANVSRELDEVNSAGMTRQRGISLVELIMFIVIVSIALTGIMQLLNLTTGRSADTLLRKQAQAAADSLLEEIQAHPFAGCTASVTQSNRTASHCIFDYNGYTTGVSGIMPADGTTTAVSGLSNYSAAVAVAASALGNIPTANAAQITVTVTPPAGPETQSGIVATGYRTAY